MDGSLEITRVGGEEEGGTVDVTSETMERHSESVTTTKHLRIRNIDLYIEYDIDFNLEYYSRLLN